MRLRAFKRIDQNQRSVGHAEDSLDLATEVGVAWRVHDVDLHALVVHRDVLRENCDAAFAFEVIRVEDAILRQLRITELATLLEQRVNKRRLAVVNVRDDGDVANILPSARSVGHDGVIMIVRQ